MITIMHYNCVRPNNACMPEVQQHCLGILQQNHWVNPKYSQLWDAHNRPSPDVNQMFQKKFQNKLLDKIHTIITIISYNFLPPSKKKQFTKSTAVSLAIDHKLKMKGMKYKVHNQSRNNNNFQQKYLLGIAISSARLYQNLPTKQFQLTLNSTTDKQSTIINNKVHKLEGE